MISVLLSATRARGRSGGPRRPRACRYFALKYNVSSTTAGVCFEDV